jgi:tetratricopeptide (TPR) repeat protein
MAALAPAVARAKEQPLGLVTQAGASKVVRAGTDLPVPLMVGELLFSGDAIRTGASPASILYCPAPSVQQIDAQSEVEVQTKGLKVRAGKLGARTPARSCVLPQAARVTVASQQRYGVTMVRALLGDRPAAASFDLQIQALPEVAALRAAAAAADADFSTQLAYATALETHQLSAPAAAAYRKLAALWPDAVWIKGKIFELDEQAAAAEAAAARAGGGRTYALLVGVSEFQNLPRELWLQYAHADAALLARHLRSPRGGGLGENDIVVLENQQATTGRIRTAFESFLKGRAGPKDTVLLFIASHGVAVAQKGAYILTYDSNPQDPAATALPMADVHKLLNEGLSKVGRVLAYVDVCRAGSIQIAASQNRAVAQALEQMGSAEGEMFGLMASRARESSVEGPNFGGGHGAFSYYLVKGLSGEADKNGDGVVDINEVIGYVGARVPENTADRQHPTAFGSFENSTRLSDKGKPGIDVARFRSLFDSAGGALLLASAAQAQGAAAAGEAMARFRGALAADPRDALALLPALKQRLGREAYLMAENEARAALEDRGQQVLLRYLAGEQSPQTRDEFERGASYYGAARGLTPESLFLQARQAFCEGRTRIFDKDYAGARRFLEQAVRLDASGAYSYNALGIAHLEQADFATAALAFRDASRLAPLWAYPRHNLGLAYAEAGRYAAAVAAYREAMRLAPRAAYIPYNLGLLYQRLDRRKAAEAAYRRAMTVAPDLPEPYAGLASLQAAAGRDAEAERLYREALGKNPLFTAARHNLAVLLSARPARRTEAITIWREILAQAPDFLPSRLTLAESLAAAGQTREAMAEYRAAIARKPDYVSARKALADLLEKAGEADGAAEQWREATRLQPGSAALLERLGDAESRRGRASEAAEAWRAALERAQRRGDRKRIEGKLAGARTR